MKQPTSSRALVSITTHLNNHKQKHILSTTHLTCVLARLSFLRQQHRDPQAGDTGGEAWPHTYDPSRARLPHPQQGAWVWTEGPRQGLEAASPHAKLSSEDAQGNSRLCRSSRAGRTRGLKPTSNLAAGKGRTAPSSLQQQTALDSHPGPAPHRAQGRMGQAAALTQPTSPSRNRYGRGRGPCQATKGIAEVAS